MLKKHKGIMIILDGLGDRRIPAFGGKTPLEAANTPNLDHLVAIGQSGLVDPMLPGVPLGTHTATGLLFGLPIRQAAELTRGPVEAAGTGILNDPEAIYIRGNFATLEKSGNRVKILDRRAGRINEEASELAESLGELELGDGIKASLHPATQHRVVIKLTGPNLSPHITNTDPGTSLEALLLECQARDGTSEARKTADAVNRLTQLIFEQLSRHPINQRRHAQGKNIANGIICRSPGRLPKLKTQIQHLGLKTAVVAGEKTVLGLAGMLGYTTISEPGFTALPDTDLESKITHTQLALREHDLVYLHIKGPDICSHDLNPTAKRELLERFDAALTPLLSDELVIAITGDHSTDSNCGRHTGDPVPSLLYGPLGRIDGNRTFGETGCSNGDLNRINSSDFLTSMLDQMNRMNNYNQGDAYLYF